MNLAHRSRIIPKMDRLVERGVFRDGLSSQDSEESFSYGIEPTTPGVSRQEFQRGRIIYNMGDSSEALFFLQSGCVQLSMPGDRRKRFILEYLRPPAIFGEGALDFGSQPTTARAVTNCQTLAIRTDALGSVLEKNPDLALKAVSLIIGHNRVHEEILEDVLFLDFAQRLHLLLLRLTADEPIPINQLDMAEHVGCTRETIFKNLIPFREKGAVQILGRRGGIKIDREKLAEIPFCGHKSHVRSVG